MGEISRGANKAIGWRIGSRDGVLVVVLDVLVWTARFLFRFFSGRPLRGDRYRRTDAEWSTRGTRKLYANDRTPLWWSWQSERTRVAIRVGFLIVGIDSVWWWWDGTLFTWSLIHDLFSSAGIIVTWVALYKLTGSCVAKFAARRHSRDLVAPIKAALAPLLGLLPREVDITMPASPANVTESEEAKRA